MFQRLQKGFNLDFLDNKIAEEQEKQKQQQGRPGPSPSKRTPSSAGARRGGGRGASPGKRTSSRLRVPTEGGGDGSPAKGPDPDSFVIGDDMSDLSISRTATPVQDKESEEQAPEAPEKDGEKQDAPAAGNKGKEKADQEELSLEVRQRLAKLETLTTRYQDLLRNYRTAHAHVAAIEPFEATLREHTPLTSISDPGALVEFLNQRSLQSDMVMEELKRISGEHREAVKERDQLKTKLDEAEKKAKEAFDEAAGLRKERDEAKVGASGKKEESSDPLGVTKHTEAQPEDDAFFSYESEVSRTEAEDKEQAVKVEELRVEHDASIRLLKDEHEAKASEMQTEIKEQKDYINELSTENASLRSDLDTTRLDLDAMENKIRVKEINISDVETQLTETRLQLEQAKTARETAQKQEEEATSLLAQTKDEVKQLHEKLNQYHENLNGDKEKLVKKAAEAETKLKKYEEQHTANLKVGGDAQGGAKRIKTLENLVKMLRDQLSKAEESKALSESKITDFELEIKRLESESTVNAAIIAGIRKDNPADDTLQKFRLEADRDREEARKLADAGKGHEAAMASLRSQLKRADKDREVAYQMIISCGKCKAPESEIAGAVETPTEEMIETPESRSRLGSETTQASTLPTGTSTPATPSVDGNELSPPGEVKKKNKKKKAKSKKSATEVAIASPQKELTLNDLLRDPELAPDVLLKAKFGDNPMVPLFANIVESAREKDERKDAERDSILEHHEAMIEELKQNVIDKDMLLRGKSEQIAALLKKSRTTSNSNGGNDQQIEELQKEISTLRVEILEKDEKISKLQDRLQGEASLLEQIDTLKEEKNDMQDDMLEHGTAATNAKHELKELKESREKLQQEFDDLGLESDDCRKKMMEAEAQRKQFVDRCNSLESEIKELKSKGVSTEELEGVKEQLSNMSKEKESLQVAKDACEKQIEELKMQHTANGVELDTKHKALSSDFDALRAKASATEKELAASHQLSQTRFKDLTAIREQYNKLQPELKKLRDESAELKRVKADQEKANSSLKRLEGKEKDLRSEIAEYKSQASVKDSEISSLREKVKKSDERSAALEESYGRARKDLEKSESTRNEAIEKRDKLQADLKKAEEELKRSKFILDDLEQKVKKFSDEASRSREELQLKSAQQASAQSLMDSMQDQTRELTTRMKEAEGRKESLEEELADAHRLLSERGREGETMRRLLADVEGRAESKVKEMREQMDLAIQERDRAEDEASTIGRRKAREVEDLKTRLREAEREASRAHEAREEAERRERDFKSRQEEIERRASQTQEEVNEIRTAMAQLRDTLDETERQSRNLEKEKVELKRLLDERDSRLEKLQKSSKAMAEELRTLQAAGKLRQGGSATPSRSSMESARVTSPVPSKGGGGSAGVDLGYLKNVLLQFLEQKERKHQMQLVPVLGMLLHFDKLDEQKWMAAVSAK